MQLNDVSHAGRSKPAHLILPGGIETLPAHAIPAAEYAVRRWASEEAWARGDRPYLSTRAGAGRLYDGTICNEGMLKWWEALRDGITGTDLFSNANTELVISNVTGSPAYTDTVVASELDRQGMDTGFPLIPGETQGTATAADREFVLRGTYGATSANGDWRRFWAVNSAGAGDLILDNFSSNQGTKVNGQVWELTVTLRVD